MLSLVCSLERGWLIVYIPRTKNGYLRALQRQPEGAGVI